MYKTSNIPDDTPGIDRIRRNCLTLFEGSAGWRIRVKGTGTPGVTDIVVAVDWKKQQVIGKKDSYHVDNCEITGQPIEGEDASFLDHLEDPDLFFTVENN